MRSKSKRAGIKEARIDIESGGPEAGRLFPYSLQIWYSPPGYRNKLRALGHASNDNGSAVVADKSLVQLQRSMRLKDTAAENPELAARIKALSALNTELRKRGSNLVLDLQEEVPLLYANFNWQPFWLKERRRIPKTEFRHLAVADVESDFGPTLPADVPALLTLRIPVTELNTWDLDNVVQEIRITLRDAIKNRPTVQ